MDHFLRVMMTMRLCCRADRRTSTNSQMIMRIAQLALAIVITVGCFLYGRTVLAQTNDAAPQGAGGVAAESIMNPAACQERLDARHVTFSSAPPVAEGDCVIPLPVRLRSLAIDPDDAHSACTNFRVLLIILWPRGSPEGQGGLWDVRGFDIVF